MTHPVTREGVDPAEAPEGAPIRFLSVEETAARVGVSRRTIYNMLDSGRFPAPVKITERRIAFVESEVREWQRARMAERG